MGRLLTFPGVPESEPERDAIPATGFYTPAEAARIARVPRQRLAAWRREGIVFPTVHVSGLDGDEADGYTFESLIYLRLLRSLRRHGIPLIETVRAMSHLRERFGPPDPAWERARIFVQGRDVFVEGADEWEVTMASRAGQKAATLLLGEEFARLRERADALLVPSEYLAAVEIDPHVRSGLPVVRGTTLPTSTLAAMSRRGLSTAAIHASYPSIPRARIKVALAYERFLDAEAA